MFNYHLLVCLFSKSEKNKKTIRCSVSAFHHVNRPFRGLFSTVITATFSVLSTVLHKVVENFFKNVENFLWGNLGDCGELCTFAAETNKNH